jgi:hypothetical protein
MDNDSRFWTTTKRRTLYLLLVSAVLSVGTPAIVAATQPGARFYLRYPLIFGAQLVPSLVAAALWLPWRSARATKTGLVLASVLCIASALAYVPIATGILPTGGDMMAVGYVVLAFGTVVAILAATAIAFAVAWTLDKRASTATSKDAARPTNAE